MSDNKRKFLILSLKAVLVLLLISQIPFVYEVLESYWLRSYLESMEQVPTRPSPFMDVRGVAHVHSASGGHSTGTYPEIIEAAKETGTAWVLLTEHPRQPRIYSEIFDPQVLMIYGWEEELDQGGRVLRDPDSRFRAFSDFGKDAVPSEMNGIELFNLEESTRVHNNLYSWVNWIYHSLTIPEMFFFQVWEIDETRMETWDSLLGYRHLTGIAGVDAHQNLGLILQTSAGKEIHRIQVDPYELSMKIVSNHLMLPPGSEVTEQTVVEALRKGSSYICFEMLGNPEGFAFYAENESGRFPPGSTTGRDSVLKMTSPFPVLFRIIWEGNTFKELKGTSFTVPVELKGFYRLEVYLVDPPYMIEGKPWIITNPVFVE